MSKQANRDFFQELLRPVVLSPLQIFYEIGAVLAIIRRLKVLRGY